VAIRHRVDLQAPLDGAVREGPVGAAWYGRFLAAVAQHPVYRRLWFGALAASVGQWMQQVALGWLAIIMTNSPGFVGIVTFSAGLPFLVVAPCGGALIDRIDRRRLMLSC
jgi:MFS family permease